jgi:Gpi18-like mannosyltransferase
MISSDATQRSGEGDRVQAALFRVPWKTLSALFIGSRFFIWLVAAVSLPLAPKGRYFNAPSSVLDWFIRWDAPWYLDVARNGYRFTSPGEETNVVFFPLYPLAIRLSSLGGMIDLRLAGYFVSLLGLAIATVCLWRAVAREFDNPRLATFSVAFLLFGPVSFFFSTLYSEAFFLPLVIVSIDAARRERWWLAGLCGMLAAFTRFVGVLLIVPLVWQLVALYGRARQFHVNALVACALPLVGFTAYCALMAWTVGDARAYFHGQVYWGRRFAWFYLLFARESFTGQPLFYQVWFTGTVVVAFALLALGARLRVPSTYSVFGLAFGFVYISSRFVEGLPRYFSVVFPLYVTAALVVTRWPRWRIPLFACSVISLTLSVTLFVNGYWFT